MATIGFSNPWMAKLDVEAGTYSDGFKCGKAISGTVTPNYSSASLYADNEEAERVDAFTSAAMTLNVSTIPAKAATVLFGHAVDSETKEVIYNTQDVANYVGVGAYEDNMVDGVVVYTAVIFPKVKFNESAVNYTTKGDNISFSTPTLEGSAAGLEGVWKKTKDFDTREAAIAWIKSELNITE